MNVELIEFKENANSPHFALANSNPNRLTCRIGGMKFFYTRESHDKYKMVGIVIKEKDYETECVLQQSGILTITKANGNNLIEPAREFSSNLTDENMLTSKKVPLKYQPVAEELIHAYHVLFN